MKTSIVRISQADPAAAAAPPPPAPDPMAGGAPPIDMGGGLGGGLGAPPMPGAPAGGPAGGAADTTTAQGVPYALENLGMILKDAELQKKLSEILSSSSNIGSTSEEEIANVIFQMYGGNKLGGIDEWKKGERKPEKQVDDEEIKNTRKERWKRLPEGKTLDTLDIPVTLDNIMSAVKAISFGISKAKSKEAPAGGGAMAGVHYKNMVKISQYLDNLGFYQLADHVID
jgi:hypothetical protein